MTGRIGIRHINRGQVTEITESGLEGQSAIRRADRRGELGVAFEVTIDSRGCRSTFGDRPDDERLTTTGIAGHEYT